MSILIEMRLRGKWRRMVAALALVAGLAAALYFLVLPAYARKKVRESLAALGAVDATFTLERVSLRGLHISHLDLGSGSWLSAASVDVHYTPASIMHGRVNAIAVREARWRVSVRDGAVDFGAQFTPATDGPTDLPFETLHVEQSTLILDWEGEVRELPLSGEISAGPGPALRLDLASVIDGRPVDVAAIIRSAADAIAFDVDLASPDALSLSAAGHYARSAASLPHEVDLSFDAAPAAMTIAAQDITIDRSKGRLRVALGDDLDVETIEGEITTAALNIGDEALHELAISFPTSIGGAPPSYILAGVYRDATIQAGGALSPLLDHALGRSSEPFSTDWQIALATPEAMVEWLAARDLHLEADSDQIEVQATTLLALPQDGFDGEWTISIPTLHAAIPDSMIRAERGTASASDIALDLSVTARLVDGAVSIEPLSEAESKLAVGLLRLESSGAEFLASSARIGIASVDGEPLARLPLSNRNIDAKSSAGAVPAAQFALHVALGIDLPGRMSMQGGTEVNLPNLAASAQLAFASDAPLSIEGELVLKQASITSRSAELAAESVSATLPFSWHDELALRGGFSVGSIRYRNQKVNGVTGSMVFDDNRLRIAADGRPLEGAALHAEGWIDFAAGADRPQTEAAFLARIPPFELGEDGQRFASALPGLEDAEVGGTFSLDAQLGYHEGALSTRITLAGQNARLVNEKWLLDIGSATGQVTFVSLDPLATSPNQTIAIDGASIGKLPIDSGTLTFTLHDRNTLSIDQAEWDMGRMGEFTADAFQLDPTAPRFTATINCWEVGLGTWLELLTGSRATGEGMLAGSIVVRVEPGADEVVAIEEGSLTAQKPPGWIVVEEIEAIEALLEKSGDLSAQEEITEEVKRRVIEALQDYQFDDLTIDFRPEDGETVTSIFTRGRGRRGPVSQEIGGFTINIRGFNDLLNTIIREGPALRRVLEGNEPE